MAQTFVDDKPVVVIVGRPNVGKSTLFNRLMRRRKALVYDQPGCTRDFIYASTQLAGEDVVLVDSGGVEDRKFSTKNNASPFMPLIYERVSHFLEEKCDVILAVFDGKEGPTPSEKELIQKLRKLNKPVIYLVNKIDHEKMGNALAPFFELGTNPLFAVSAEHGRGLEPVLAELQKALKQSRDSSPQHETVHAPVNQDEVIKIALIGRPNVGKSTLMNTLLEEERALVSPVPGTTRDPVEGLFIHETKPYELVDTAGVRRKGKTLGGQTIEGLSVIQTIKAVDESYIVILVLDLAEGITEQDAKVASLAHKRGRGILIFANKLDLYLEKKKREGGKRKWSMKKIEEEITEDIYWHMPFLQYAPIICGSALLQKFPRNRFFALLRRIENARHLVIPTQELNEYIEEVLNHHPLPMRKGKRLKLFYLTQALARNEAAQNDDAEIAVAEGEPPSKGRLRPSTPKFVCFVNAPQNVHYSDERFLINCLRKRYSLIGNPVSIVFRGRNEMQKR